MLYDPRGEACDLNCVSKLAGADDPANTAIGKDREAKMAGVQAVIRAHAR